MAAKENVMPTVRGPRIGDGPHAAPLAASRFRNSQVFTPGGQSGRVTNVVIGEDGRHHAIVDFGRELGSHQVPLASFAYEGSRFVVHESDVRSLPFFVEGQRGMRMIDPNATLDIQGYRGTDGDDSTILVQNAAPQVTVQRPALHINWEQAAPQVTVHQPTPHVNVRQSQPIIIVRQPPPKVTVELEQPEIIVRMAEPDVDVSIAEPQVQVSVPRPHVQVVQPEQPQVNIVAGEPLVSLLPRDLAEVAFQRSQPEVRFERLGEPQVIFHQANGGPRVRIEEVSRADVSRADVTRAASVRRPGMVTATALKTAQLEGRKVFSLEGTEVGAVHRVLVGHDGKLAIILARGGFLGFKPKRILLPITNFAIRGDRLLIRDMTTADIGKIDAWDEKMDLYKVSAGERPIDIALWS
jgi:hypothetical protein